jgi:hypothetical protein
MTNPNIPEEVPSQDEPCPEPDPEPNGPDRRPGEDFPNPGPDPDGPSN